MTATRIVKEVVDLLWIRSIAIVIGGIQEPDPHARRPRRPVAGGDRATLYVVHAFDIANPLVLGTQGGNGASLFLIGSVPGIGPAERALRYAADSNEAGVNPPRINALVVNGWMNRRSGDA